MAYQGLCVLTSVRPYKSKARFFYGCLSSFIIMRTFTQIVHGSLILIIVFLCKHTSNRIFCDIEIKEQWFFVHQGYQDMDGGDIP